MTLACTIQGNPVSIQAGTFNANYTLNNRPTGSFAVYYDGAVPGDEGDEVIITRVADSYKVFAGRVTSVTLSQGLSGNRVATFQVGGYESLADRRIVAEVYFNRTAGYIVADLISKYLSGDGVTAGTIDAGASIPRAVFGYRQLSDVLRTLADANGYIWYIDRDKALHFTERDAVASPNAIDSGTAGDARAIRGVSYDKSLTQYRNRQFVQYNELTSLRTERFAGDGQTQTFSVEFPIAQVPTITVNGVAKTVGIRGLDNSKEWYWEKGSGEVSQEILDAALTTDGRVVSVNVGADVPFLSTVIARGEYAIAVWNEPGTLNRGIVLFKIEGFSIIEVYRLPIITDETTRSLSALWVDNDTILLQYYNATPNQWTQIIYSRIGDLLVTTAASMNELPVFFYQQSSNGKYIAAIKSVLMAHDTVLWVYDKDTGTLRVGDTLAYDSSYNIPNMAVKGAYIVQYSTHTDGVTASRIRLFRINPTTDTFALADTLTVSGSFTTAGGQTVVIGEYVFVLLGVSPNINIKIYKIDTAADTIAFVSDWVSPSWVNAFSPSVQRITRYGDKLVLSGNFSGGDLVLLRFDTLSEDLQVAHFLENEINGYVSVSDRGWGIYDSVAALDDRVRLFEFSSDLLEVKYVGSFPNVTQVDEFSEQAARVAAEGGTGIYEAFQSASDTDSEPSAIDIAQAILERYGRIPRSLNAETRVEGYEAGQIVTINWPSLGISNEEFLIERMGIRDERGTALWYSLRCISGRDIGNWQEFWRSLRPSWSFDFGGSETLPRSAAVQEMVTVGDEATAVSAATETNWDEGNWDEGNWDEMEWQ